MRSSGVELVHEGIEARLLLQAVHARRAGGNGRSPARPGQLVRQGEGNKKHVERPEIRYLALLTRTGLTKSRP